MKKTLLLAFLSALALIFQGCSRYEDYEGGYEDTPTGNFEALWHIMDTRYCFFDEKEKAFGLDWDSIYAKYRPSVSDDMSMLSLFEVMAAMVGELRDGHVNIYGPYDIARNWTWKTEWPDNFSEKVQELYLGDDYLIAGSGYCYRMLDDNTGYLAIQSFSNRISEGKLDAVLTYLTFCNGLIIDIRDNGGGNVSTAQMIASRFADKKTLVGYSRYKTGPGHNDFSEWNPSYIEPDNTHVRWLKPVAVLTNRGCFSAANDFAVMMKQMPRARLFGDTTGGGGGVPSSSELPCGWSVRFSSASTRDALGNDVENGIEPDERVEMTDLDVLKDPIIEAARQWIASYIVNP